MTGRTQRSQLPPVTVIVPVLNGEDTIRVCVASILATDYPEERRDVIVVDNGSTDRTPEIVRSLPVRCVREDRRGRPHARNRGVREAGSDILAFTDADCVVTKHWLADLAGPFADPAVSGVAGEVVAFPPTTGVERYVARRKPYWQTWTADRPIPWFLSGNVALRREVFDRIGPFDPTFARLGCEDIDLAWRFFDAGLRLHRSSGAVVFHRHRTTLRSFIQQNMSYGRGQAFLCRKHAAAPRWGVREEAGAWRDLGASTVRLAASELRRLVTGRRGDPSYARCDLIRKLAQRIGFMRGTLRWTVERAGGIDG